MFALLQNEFFSFFALFTLALITLLWVRELHRQRKNDWDISQKHSCVCDQCHHTFLMNPNQTIGRCPRCNTICIFKRHR